MTVAEIVNPVVGRREACLKIGKVMLGVAVLAGLPSGDVTHRILDLLPTNHAKPVRRVTNIRFMKTTRCDLNFATQYAYTFNMVGTAPHNQSKLVQYTHVTLVEDDTPAALEIVKDGFLRSVRKVLEQELAQEVA